MTLIKYVVQAMPAYTRSTFSVQSGVCKTLDRLVKQFWWSSDMSSNCYMALKKWEDICKPKD